MKLTQFARQLKEAERIVKAFGKIKKLVASVDLRVTGSLGRKRKYTRRAKTRVIHGPKTNGHTSRVKVAN